MSVRICKKCGILGDLPGDVASYAKKLYDMMPESQRADEDLIEKRLKICSECKKRQDQTCLECGCYIQIRSFAKANHCPVKKW